jgi:SpoVK/Ycf46/Vps4 family AAA+-type ATPase
MALAENVRKMVLAYKRGDVRSFQAAVKEVIHEERQKRHHTVADDLERILSNGTSPNRPNQLIPLFPELDVPRDKERGAVLIESRQAAKSKTDLVLPQYATHDVDRIVAENKAVATISSYGLRPSRKILFCGPPGCGKTLSAEVIAKELYLPFFVVRFDAVISSYLGETAANLRKVFEFAGSRPMVLLFDEFDAIGKERGDSDEHGELKRVVNAFLQMLDSFDGESLVIAATNHEQLLDTALWRRFDEVVVFPLPTQAQIVELLTRYLRQIGVQEGINLKLIARRVSMASHADIERLATDAIKTTILNGESKISMQSLDDAVRKLNGRADLSSSKRKKP